ncbi:MAG: hypothetical protein JO280_01435 [Mycobacteriaceae bacterium]|nr:hypothetical protein [Mycobacteriaceae bacterium]
MDQDDAEQRIAELERQLAPQKRRADLPPARPDRTAEPRRFVATTPRMATWLLICTYGLWTALVAVFAVMFAVPSARTLGWVVLVGVAVGLTLFGVLGVRWWGWNNKIRICVTSDGLTVDKKPGEVFSFKDAKLGLWAHGLQPTLSGTALHLQCGPHRLVLGGRDHQLGTATPLQAPPAGRVDGWLQAADFDEVLTMAARRSGLDVRGPAPGEPLRCLLYPPPEPMGPFAFRRKQQTPQPRLAIDLGADAIRVIDPNTNALVASASRSRVTATAANYKVVDPEGSYNMPVLVVGVPGLLPLTIETRRAWRGKVPMEKKKPEFRVSEVDSLALVEKFGLAPYLEEKTKR